MDEGVCAIRPGTDVGRYARLLARTHDALLSGDRPPVDPRRLVARSGSGCRPRASTRTAATRPGPLDASQVEQRRARSPLHQVLPELRAALTAVAEDARHVMVVTDADGVLLWREGSTRVRHRADALGFTEGARWTEGAVGTNAIGTALAEDAPVQIFSAEHFVRTHHGWTRTACPVHDPRSGELLGVVDVSGPAETVHPTTVALVGTAVKLAEASLWRLPREAARRAAHGRPRRCWPPPRGRGWSSTTTAGSPPCAACRTWTGSPCRPRTVPSPSPAWALRAPAGARRVAAAPGASGALPAHPRARRPPAAGGRRRHQRWVHPLSTRHAEVLPAARPRRAIGMDAAALSTALYGHGGSLGDDPRGGLPAPQGDRRDPAGPALPARAGGRGRRCRTSRPPVPARRRRHPRSAGALRPRGAAAPRCAEAVQHRCNPRPGRHRRSELRT